MTAVMEPTVTVVGEPKPATACECVFVGGHPDHWDEKCDREAVYMVRLRHVTDDCDDIVHALCQECLDARTMLAECCVGKTCVDCGYGPVRSVSELVGPVMPL